MLNVFSTMNLEITYEAADEEVTMILDDSIILKASLGIKNELILNPAFISLENENDALYAFLRRTAKELFKLTDI